MRAQLGAPNARPVGRARCAPSWARPMRAQLGAPNARPVGRAQCAPSWARPMRAQLGASSLFWALFQFVECADGREFADEGAGVLFERLGDVVAVEDVG